MIKRETFSAVVLLGIEDRLRRQLIEIQDEVLRVECAMSRETNCRRMMRLENHRSSLQRREGRILDAMKLVPGQYKGADHG